MNKVNKIRERMDELGMSPSSLFVKLEQQGYNIHWRTVQRWYEGEGDPAAAAFRFLAVALDCDVSDILPDMQPAAANQ